VEKVPATTSSACVRRVFYQVEGLSNHLSISTASADRYDTPTSRQLCKKYAQRPMGNVPRFLPVARGKSIFKSNLDSRHGSVLWTKPLPRGILGDYRRLDSLLEPTGNIKVAQEKAARAFGQIPSSSPPTGTFNVCRWSNRHVGSWGPCHVGRMCHKITPLRRVCFPAHFPLYVEAYPLTQFHFHVWSGEYGQCKKVSARFESRGKAGPCKAFRCSRNCILTGISIHVERVMDGVSQSKPDLISVGRSVVGLARWSPFLLPADAGAAAHLGNQPRFVPQEMRSGLIARHSS